MPRRRLPPQRRSGPGPGPNPRAKRISDNGRGSGKGGIGSVGDVDWTSVARAVVLVLVVAGVATFLFYPDITRLIDRWQNASRDSTQNEAEQRMPNEPHEIHGRQPDSNGRGKSAADVGEDARKATTPQPGRSDKKVSEANGKATQPPARPQPDPSSSGGSARTGATGPAGDFMEEEEEEEDLVEVELMEEEEPAVFVDIGSNEEEEEEESGLPSKAKEDSEMRRVRDAGDEEEPTVLADGQTITFTPVSSGGKNIIRLGGRPKPEGKAKTPAKSTADKTKSASLNSSKSDTSKPVKRNSSKSEQPESKKSKSSKSTAHGSKPKNTDDREKMPPPKDDLPEEVQNFKPTYLRTVKAKKIFADGRRIPPVELIPEKETNSSVRVFLFNEFLSEAECDGLRRVHDKHVQEMSLPPLLCFDSITTLRKHLQEVNRDMQVTPKDFIKGTRCVNATFSRTLSEWLTGNWSYSTAFYTGESRFSAIFEARVQEAMGLDPRNGGKFQITSYPTGKAYKAHTDCVLGGTDQRDRVVTVLVYLDDVSDGGETKFPELGIWVKPRKGRALVWNNMSPEGRCEPHSLHVASKVNAGSKYILIRWYYYKSFYSLGKRPPEPPIPDRPPGTPRVSCDDYDNGSCRWYDEWNNDHLLDYEMQKYTLI